MPELDIPAVLRLADEREWDLESITDETLFDLDRARRIIRIEMIEAQEDAQQDGQPQAEASTRQVDPVTFE